MSEEESKENLENKETAPSTPPKKKRRWPKVLAIIFALFCCLLAGLYFYISSASFVRSQVFSRVQAQLNQPISAEGINFSPFSSLELNDFTLGDDPFLKAQKIKVAYDLMSIINGNIKVNEVTVENAELNVIVNRDGKLNILSKVVEKIEDKPAPKAKKKSEKKAETAEKKPKPKPKPKKKIAKKEDSGPPPNLDIQNINFKNLKLHVFIDHSKKEKRVELNLDNFSFSIPALKNGEDLKYELETAINCKAGENFNLKNGTVKLSGSSKLTQELKPELLNIDIKISDLDAVNEKVQLPLKALNVLADIGIDGSKVNLNTFKIQNPANDSGVSASGLLEEGNVDLSLAVTNVDSSILDIALIPLSASKPFRRWQKELSDASKGTVAGFGKTMINYNGSVKGNPDNNLNLSGEVDISSLPMVRISSKSEIVPLSAKINYELNSNKDEFLIQVKKMSLNIKDPQNELASIEITSPVTYDLWYKTLQSEKEDKVAIKLNRFDLNLTKAFKDEDERGAFEQGFVSLDCLLISKNSGKDLALDLKSLSLNELAVKKDDEIISDINIQTSTRLSLSDLAKVNLEDLKLAVKQGSNELTSLSASGLINLDKIEANIKLSSLKVHPHVKKFVPQKTIDELGLNNINLSSDSMDIFYTKGGVKAEGNLSIREMALGGSKLPTPFTLSKAANFKVSYDETKTLTLDNLELSLSTNGQNALSTKLSAKQNEEMGLLTVQFSDLRLQPGLDKFIPADLKKKFGLSNINLDSKDLSVNILKDKITAKGSLFCNGLVLGGEQFQNKFKLSQSSTFDLTLIQDQLLDLKSLKLNLQTDNNEALVLDTNATYRPGDKAVNLKVRQLAVSPGLKQLLPAELTKQYGLNNLNAKSNGIEVSYAEGKTGFVKANLEVKDLGIGGTAYNPFSLSQGLDVDLAIDNKGLLKIGKFHSKTKPSFSDEVEVQAKGQIDLNFNRDDSEIIIDVPSSVDVDSLLKLAKAQEKKQSAETVKTQKPQQTAETVKQPKDKSAPGSQPKAPQAPKKNPVKLTVKASVKEVLFDKQSIKNIRTTAFINDQTYTLKEAVLQIGEGILKAAGRMHNGPTKSMSVNVSSSGPINLGPVNDIINKGTNKKISGNVTIQQFSATTSGKNNEEMTKNLNSTIKLFLQDLKVKNYAKVPAVGWFTDKVMDVDPENLEFKTGNVDLKINEGIVTINQLLLESDALYLNPRGTINLNNNTYDIKSNTSVGFAGSKWLNTIITNPLAMNFLNQKTDEFQKFLQDFPYDKSKNKFVMKDDYIFNKIIKMASESGSTKSPLSSLSGLNETSSDYLVDLFLAIGKKTNLKEAASIAQTLNGEGNVGDNLLNIGRGLLERELNKDRDKDKENMKEEEKSDPVRGLLEGILGGNKKKKEDKKKEEPKKEDKKKEEPINKKDDLIKKLDDLFK